MSRLPTKKPARWAALLAVVGAVVSQASAVGGWVRAASQNEVTIDVIYDGTSAFDPTNNDPTDSNIVTDPQTTPATTPALHTPGRDSGPNNLVVRSYDAMALRIDWDVNEASATNVVLKVDLPGYLQWAPDATGMFAGCLPGSTIVNSNGNQPIDLLQSIDPARATEVSTLTCLLGEKPEGSHGTIRPIARMYWQPDNTTFTPSVVMTTNEDSSGTVRDTVPTPLTVSEAPVGDWIKAAPSLVSGVDPNNTPGTTADDGYVLSLIHI